MRVKDDITLRLKKDAEQTEELDKSEESGGKEVEEIMER